MQGTNHTCVAEEQQHPVSPKYLWCSLKEFACRRLLSCACANRSVTCCSSCTASSDSSWIRWLSYRACSKEGGVIAQFHLGLKEDGGYNTDKKIHVPTFLLICLRDEEQDVCHKKWKKLPFLIRPWDTPYTDTKAKMTPGKRNILFWPKDVRWNNQICHMCLR